MAALAEIEIYFDGPLQEFLMAYLWVNGLFAHNGQGHCSLIKAGLGSSQGSVRERKRTNS